MIKSFRHKALKSFFNTGSTKGINPQHAEKIKRQLSALDRAIQPEDMNIPGWQLHPLAGKLADHWSVKVNGNWRITFMFEGSEPILVDYQDYH
ncbi:MAG: peptidase [Gammaproteobacteria bacterium]|nr:MAG: peptidase [Gammaproteobacteria bacterium]